MIKKRVCEIITIFVLLFLCIVTTPVAGASESVKKIVSIVYDDSESMNNTDDRWCYANYALQMFVGMLNDGDQLFVTYMSDAYNAEKSGGSATPVTINLGARQSSIDTIRGKHGALGTPYQAVETAYNKLGSVSGDASTQYWLVIITDGAFFDDVNNDNSCPDGNELLQRFQSYYNESAANNRNLFISYMAIDAGNGDVIKINDDPSCNISSSVTSNDEIVNTFSSIAESITGKFRLDAKDIESDGSDTIKIHSDLPLANIISIVQGTPAKLTAVKDGSGNTYQITRNVNVKAPEGIHSTVDLAGIIGMCDAKSGNIPAGDYYLTFDSSVNAKDIDILMEPSLATKIIFTGDADGDGKSEELTPPYEIFAGMEIEISAVVYDPATGLPIDDSILKKYDIDYDITYSEDGNLVESSDRDGTKIKIGEGTSGEIIANVTVNPFSPMGDTVSFSITPKKVISVSVADSYDPAEEIPDPEKPDKKKTTPETTYVFPSIFNKDEVENICEIPFVVKADDVSMSADEINAADIKVSHLYDCEVSDGQIILRPKEWKAINWVFDFHLSHTAKVVLTVDGVSAETVLNLDPSGILIDVIIILLFLAIISAIVGYLLFCFFSRRRFKSLEIKRVNKGYRRPSGMMRGITITNNEADSDEIEIGWRDDDSCPGISAKLKRLVTPYYQCQYHLEGDIYLYNNKQKQLRVVFNSANCFKCQYNIDDDEQAKALLRENPFDRFAAGEKKDEQMGYGYSIIQVTQDDITATTIRKKNN